MRVVAFVNNTVGLTAVETIQKNGDQIVAVVVHTQNTATRRDDILEAVRENSIVVEANNLRNPNTLESIAALNPEIGVSAFFGHILYPELIDIFPNGIINVHPSYLPHNRGAYPNVWAIAEGTPAGATVHYIDVGIDTGDIVEQTKILIAPDDTGETLYRKLENTCAELFAQTWSSIAKSTGKLSGRAQSQSEGSSHKVKDAEKIDRIDLDAQYTAGDLINIIRARTFNEHQGAYFEKDGTKYFLRIEIEKQSIQDDNS